MIIFGGYKDKGIKGCNFLSPDQRMRLTVLAGGGRMASPCKKPEIVKPIR